MAAHALIALAAAAALAGHPAERRPIYSPDPPRHPFMAPNGRSNLHVDAYQTDVHQAIGPLGRDLRVRNQNLRDSRAPFAPTLRGRGRLRAVVRLLDGRTVRL